MRWEEPQHPGPGLQLERHFDTHSPTLQHTHAMKSHLQVNDPWTESGPANANSLRGAEFARRRRTIARRLLEGLAQTSSGGAVGWPP
jgi:hypothetical protein